VKTCVISALLSTDQVSEHRISENRDRSPNFGTQAPISQPWKSESAHLQDLPPFRSVPPFRSEQPPRRGHNQNTGPHSRQDEPMLWNKKGQSFISNRQRRKEGTFCASELAGIEPTPPRRSRVCQPLLIRLGGAFHTN
jgi:hypothetical protein